MVCMKKILKYILLSFTLVDYNGQTMEAKNGNDSDIEGNSEKASVSSQEKINKIWKGKYSLFIVYGKLDELSSMSIGYDIEISDNKCVFSGMGYQTSFTDQCQIEENKNQIILKYEKSLDEDAMQNHSKTDTLAILTFKNNKYYLKSPFVANKDWKYNTEIIIKKE